MAICQSNVAAPKCICKMVLQLLIDGSLGVAIMRFGLCHTCVTTKKEKHCRGSDVSLCIPVP